MRMMKFFAAAAMWVLLGSISFGYSGGDGTAANPYQIASKADLLSMAADTGNYDKCYILIKDINMQGQGFDAAVIAPNTVLSETFHGTAFSGIFDGNGYKITNFSISSRGCHVGLFGYIHTNGQIKNLGVDDCTIDESYCCAGGLAGTNEGNIIHCYSTAIVTNLGDSYSAGSLIGDNGGVLIKCYSTGYVWAYIGAGGLVGSNSGTIKNCYATGTVASMFSTGGLAGSNAGILENCYATGRVQGDTDAGGLVGSNSGMITSCYAAGRVTAFDGAGGLVAYNNRGTVNGSFWDTQTSGCTTSADGTGKTTVQMKTLLTFTMTGWDFTNETANGTKNIWRMCANGIDYPRLSWESVDGDFACPDGVSVEDLDYFVGRWMLENCTADNNYCGGVDVDSSGTVDLADYAVLAEHWLEGV